MLFRIVFLALIFAVSACGGASQGPAAPTNPTNPAEPKWSTVGGLRITPLAVKVGQFADIEVQLTELEAGITQVVEFSIVRPDGGVDKKTMTRVSGASGQAGWVGFGYQTKVAGTHSVSVTVTQAKSDLNGSPADRAGTLQVQQ